MPEYRQEEDLLNYNWSSPMLITIQGYKDDAMEVGLSKGEEFLLFNDKTTQNKDIHWSKRIIKNNYQYMGKVQNTNSDKVDGTPSFDSNDKLYFTSLKTFPSRKETIFVSPFDKGVALNPTPVEGNIYREDHSNGHFWVALDPDITEKGEFIFFSEGKFYTQSPLPYPFNVCGAIFKNGSYKKLNKDIFKNINTNNMEYAPAISSDGLEIFFTRVAKVNGKLKFIGIFTASRKSTKLPFSIPKRIASISGQVEAPALSHDGHNLYFHKLVKDTFKIFYVKRIK